MTDQHHPNTAHDAAHDAAHTDDTSTHHELDQAQSEETVKLDQDVASNEREDRRQTTLKPRANLYASEDGWLLIAALPQADPSQTTLDTEGTTLKLSAPRLEGGVYKRTLRFPRDTVWGDLKARWEGDLLYVELPRATPERRSVSIS